MLICSLISILLDYFINRVTNRTEIISLFFSYLSIPLEYIFNEQKATKSILMIWKMVHQQTTTTSAQCYTFNVFDTVKNSSEIFAFLHQIVKRTKWIETNTHTLIYMKLS